MTEYRPTVEAWRFDLLCPEGWLAWTTLPGEAATPRGWFVRAKASCLADLDPITKVAIMMGRDVPEEPHQAPDPDCRCGLYGVTGLNLDVADALDSLAASRELAAVEQDDPELEDWLAVTLSRVTLTGVLPAAERPGGSAHEAEGAILDPPGTIRGRRMTYREIFVDREWPTRLDHDYFPSPDWWPPTTYVPDLAEWVRGQCAAEVADLLPGGTE